MNAPQGSLRIPSDREWILTNGLGGYALGFGNMMNKRKYNGLLISSLGQNLRVHTLASLEEKVETGDNSFYLDSNHYVNCIYPLGYSHIVGSWLRPYPCTIYSSSPAHHDYLILKELFIYEGQNAVAIKYSNLGAMPLNIIVRPKFTLRDHHSVNSLGTWDRVCLEKDIRNSSFRIRRNDNGFEAYGYVFDGSVLEDRAIYRSVFYPLESLRGYEAVEDVIAPCRIDLSLEAGQSSYVIVSSMPLEHPLQGAEKAELKYKQFPLSADHPSKVTPKVLMERMEENCKIIFEKEDYLKILQLAAYDFITQDDDIIAGYPWFGAWSRDTMISLGGFRCLPNGEEGALRILNKYGASIRDGLLPNTFGEGGEGVNYESIDAPLWYVLRCFEYGPGSKELFAYASTIVLNYLYNEAHSFFAANDELLEIKHGDHGLTWMDAKVYGKPVTPRWGKPVEINALWYNSLCAVAIMAEKCGANKLTDGKFECSLDAIKDLASKVKEGLQRFIGDDYLADRLDNDEPVWEIRPNAVIALSLPFDFVSREVMRNVWTQAREKLVLPYGLRSLDPASPAFKGKYVGSQKQRDLAYHQGTVWSFLLLPFVKLMFKVLGDEIPEAELKKEVSQLIWTLRNDFMKGKAASVAEVWDGIDPYFPKGCPAQAWSVFALLEIEHMLANGRRNNL